MPVNQLAVNITSPGNLGLNTERESSNLSPEWAVDADNMVIDNAGRLASRKGWVDQTPDINKVAGTITQTHTYVTELQSTILSISDGKIYNGASLTDITGSLTFTNSNFQFGNLNNAVMGAELNEPPIYFDDTLATFETAQEQIDAWTTGLVVSIGDITQPTVPNGFYYVATTNGTTGGVEPTFPTGLLDTVVDGTVTWQANKIPQGDAIFAGYGRAWMSDATKTVVHYSDLLIPYKFSGGSAGFIDLKTIWVYGMDEIVAIDGFNGFLIIFGKNSILIFSGTDDPDTLSLVENIRGVGCVARDSVQHTGEDIIFLSGSGVRSLARVIQEKSNPVGDETRNVRNFLQTFVNDIGDKKTIKSAYSEVNGFYLLLLPEFDRFFVLDTRIRLEDGSRRITTWTGVGASSVTADVDDEVFFGRQGGLARYQGFLDGEDDIRLLYKSGWIKLDEEGRLYQLKRIDALVIAASNTGVVVKWAWDFNAQQCVESQSTEFIPDVSEFNVAQYNIDEYGILEDSFNVRIAPIGQGNSLQIELNTNVPNTDFRLQQLGIILKRGRLD